MADDTDISTIYDAYAKEFDASGYLKDGKVEVSDRYSYTYADGSDSLATGKQLVLSFQHVPTGRSIFFKAFITAFNETYSSDWASELVYGRADPIYLFKNTTRRITLAFTIPASTTGEAYENLGKVQGLTQFLYPNYTDVDYAQTISQSPLVRLKVMNLLQTTKNEISSPATTEGSYGITKNIFYNNYKTTVGSSGGLLGAISSMVVNHHIDDPNVGVFYKTQNTILPKVIEINIEFMPIHEHPLGWNEEGDFGITGVDGKQVNFPYGVQLDDPVAKYRDIANDGSEGALSSAIAAYQQDMDAIKQLEDDRSLIENWTGAEQALASAAAQEQGFFEKMKMKRTERQTGRKDDRAAAQQEKWAAENQARVDASSAALNEAIYEDMKDWSHGD